jgi:hypothetical protein
MRGSTDCPVCETGQSAFHAAIDGYDYLRCEACGSLHIDPVTLAAIDAGHSTRVYDENYWRDELSAARSRANGESQVRVGEAILYARRPVRRFLDVGAGPGYLLDAMVCVLPAHKDMFHAVEMFPPEGHSTHANFHVGDVGDLHGRFDAGVCIEVAEHLTPKMLRDLARGLARISEPGSLWLFNTGMPELVLHDDPGYLDPLHRGHIVAYGLRGVAHIFEPLGFRISPVPGKTYAWFAEFSPTEAPDFETRVYHSLAENRRLLERSGLLFQAAFESARASLYLDRTLERTRWALQTECELSAAGKLHAALQSEHEGVAKWAHALRDELGGLRGQYLALQSEHEGVAKWAHALRDELDAVRGQKAVLQDELTRLRSLHAQVLNSRSWRLTRPLRAMAAKLRLLRRSPSAGEGHRAADAQD